MSSLQILLLEDNPGDARLVEEFMERCPFKSRLTWVRDGVEGLKNLRSNECLPDVILMDLNMPKRDGWETLGDIRADPDLCHLPVVVLSTEEQGGGYRLDADLYVVKGMDLNEHRKAMELVREFCEGVLQLKGSPSHL